MIVNKLIKERVKKTKACSEYVLRPFFDLKMALKVLAIASFFMFSSDAHASWFDRSESYSRQSANPETINVNVPEEVREQIEEKIKTSVANLSVSTQEPNCLPYDEREMAQNAAETMALVNAKICAALSKTNSNFLYVPPPYIKDPEAFKKFQWCLFESLASLADQAQEPLFLDNKQQLSVEIRPFATHTPNSCGAQLGVTVTPRYHWKDSYVSGQFLYATSSKKSREISGSLTYGHFFNHQFAASMTLAGGYDWATFLRKDDRRSYISDPKVWSIGLSPMLVYWFWCKKFSLWKNAYSALFRFHKIRLLPQIALL